MSSFQESKALAAKSTDAVSALSPVDPSTVSQEDEKSAPWIVRKLAGSITGRIVMSSYESFRAAGTSVVCLSPWGDSSPLLLPCIRFRDIALHAAITATGGMAAVAAPIMGPVSDLVLSSFGDTILVEGSLHVGFDLGSKLLDEFLIDKPIEAMIPMHDSRLATTKVKTLGITLKYNHTVEDAALGFYRSSLHREGSLFSSVKDYLGVEKGWFSPYLFASGRRPIIPRTLKPDVIFCHAPFLSGKSGDYKIGETLLAESASMISLCPETIASPSPSPTASPTPSKSAFSNLFHRESTTSSISSDLSSHTSLSAVTQPPPRRMVILLIGLKPHRALWSTSARPSESVMYYQLLNGVPAIVLPVKPGAPLLAWDGLTLEQLWKIDPKKTEGQKGGIWGIIDVLSEYLEFCVDFERVVVNKAALGSEVADANVTDDQKKDEAMKSKRNAIRNALTVFIIGVVRSGESKEVRKEVDKERSGIAMWRIP